MIRVFNEGRSLDQGFRRGLSLEAGRVEARHVNGFLG